MKRARVSNAVSNAPRDIVRLNVGGQRFQTSRQTLCRSSGFFACLLNFDGGDKDAEGNIFVDRFGKLFEILLECLRTSRRPPQKTIGLWKMQLLEECKYFAADDAAARIMGRTCDADLSPSCRLIAVDEAEGNSRLLDVFEASLERKDVADLQLPPLLLARACDKSRADPVLAGDFNHCKESLNVQTGGLLLGLLQDPVMSKFVVVAGGAVVSALTGCDSGARLLFV